jgi:prevent-host-death family protein
MRVTLMTLILSVNEDSVDLAHLLERIRQGEEIIIAESGQPVARLVPIAESGAPRVPGSAAGQIVIADDFDAPLPEPVLGAFEQ